MTKRYYRGVRIDTTPGYVARKIADKAERMWIRIITGIESTKTAFERLAKSIADILSRTFITSTVRQLIQELTP